MHKLPVAPATCVICCAVNTATVSLCSVKVNGFLFSFFVIIHLLSADGATH